VNNGTVMVTGGWDANNNTLASTEIYDPVAGVFGAVAGLNVPRPVQEVPPHPTRAR